LKERPRGQTCLPNSFSYYAGDGGKRCLSELLKMNPDAKILIASGYSPDGALDETLDIGARQILRKPFHLHQMLKVVAEVLDAR